MEQSFGTRLKSVAIMRHPTEQIRSWYSYRTVPRLEGTDLYTADIDFETYVREVCSDDPPPRAQLGSQFSFLTDDKAAVVTDHIFAYDTLPVFVDFMSEHLSEKIALKEKNVSPKVEAPLSPATEKLLRDARADEFALYERVLSADGHLQAT